MEKKDERNPRVPPAGTFAASDPPPAPPRRSDPGPDGQRPVLADGVARSSWPSPPAGAEGGEGGIDRRRYTNTLPGTGGQSGSDGAPAPVAPVLAPPKWRGAKAYLEGQGPNPRVSSIPTHVPLPGSDAVSSDPPARVNTKLGPAPPPPPHPAALVPNAEAAIDQAIERMLEGQTAVPMEVEVSEPDAGPDDDVEALEELPMDAATPIDDPSERAVPLARLALKPVPVRVALPAAPGAAAEQAARERSAAASAPIGALEPVMAPQAPMPAAPPAEQPSAPSVPRGEPEPRPEPAADSAPARARKRANESPAVSTATAAAAARAPVAAAGVPRAARTAVAQQGDQQLMWGVVLLSAMVLVGAGGWLVTRGGFRRSVPPPEAVVATAAAPVTEPLVPIAPPAPPANAAVTSTPTEAAAAVSATALHAARESHSAHGHSNARHEPEPEPTAVASNTQPEPPVLRVLPQGAASTPSETPTRREVLDALEPLRPAVERCARGQHGVAQLDITVVNTGAVTHAVVAGDFAGTPEGSCIALAARNARFAPFQKPRFRVIYPFAL